MLQRFIIKSRLPVVLPLRVKFPEKSYQDDIVILQFAQISQILFQDTTEILSENRDCFEDQECITDSPIPCAQIIPEISVSDQVEEQSSSRSSSINEKKYRSPKESNRKLVAFSPEKDGFIRKRLKTYGFVHWTSILISFSFRKKRTHDSIENEQNCY